MKALFVYSIPSLIAFLPGFAVSLTFNVSGNDIADLSLNNTDGQTGLLTPLRPSRMPKFSLMTIDTIIPDDFPPIPLGYAYLYNIYSFWKAPRLLPIDHGIVMEDPTFRTVKMIYTKVDRRNPPRFNNELAMWATVSILEQELRDSQGSYKFYARSYWVISDRQIIGEIESVPYNHPISASVDKSLESEASGVNSTQTSKRDATTQLNQTEFTTLDPRSVDLASNETISFGDNFDMRFSQQEIDSRRVNKESLVELIKIYALFFMESKATDESTKRFEFDLPICQTAVLPLTLYGNLVIPRPVSGSRLPTFEDIVDCLFAVLRSSVSMSTLKGFKATCSWLRSRGDFAVLSVSSKGFQ